MWVFVDRKTERILAAGHGEGSESNHDMSVGYLLAVPEREIELVGWEDRHPVSREVYLRDVKQYTAEEATEVETAKTKRKAEKAKATRILGYTDGIPSEMIIIKRNLDDETKEAIRKAVLSVSEDMLIQISQGELTVTAVVKATEKDLDQIEAVIAAVEKKRK